MTAIQSPETEYLRGALRRIADLGGAQGILARAALTEGSALRRRSTPSLPLADVLVLLGGDGTVLGRSGDLATVSVPAGAVALLTEIADGRQLDHGEPFGYGDGMARLVITDDGTLH